MATIIPFPNQGLSERLEPLRNFLDEAEADELGVLCAEERKMLALVLDYAWPGAIANEQPWVTKLAFALAGFAIGFGIYT